MSRVHLPRTTHAYYMLSAACALAEIGIDPGRDLAVCERPAEHRPLSSGERRCPTSAPLRDSFTTPIALDRWRGPDRRTAAPWRLTRASWV
jgi:hypothetical protein